MWLFKNLGFSKHFIFVIFLKSGIIITLILVYFNIWDSQNTLNFWFLHYMWFSQFTLNLYFLDIWDSQNALSWFISTSGILKYLIFFIISISKILKMLYISNFLIIWDCQYAISWWILTSVILKTLNICDYLKIWDSQNTLYL